MDRTETIIKYLEEYKHVCYLKAARIADKAGNDYYQQKMKDIGNLIKELREHGCRRTIR